MKSSKSNTNEVNTDEMDARYKGIRPYTAPDLVSFNCSAGDIVLRNVVCKDSQLKGWSSTSDKLKLPPSSKPNHRKCPRESKTAHFSSVSRKNSTNLRKLANANGVNGGKSKSSNKWYLKNNTTQLDFELPFQHHSDICQYMSEYRAAKMEKIHEMYNDEIQNAFTPDIHVHEPIIARTFEGYCSNHHGISIQSPVDREEFQFSYRLEGREENKRRHDSPIKIRGKTVESKEEKLKERANRRNKSYLPKCERVVISTRTDSHVADISPNDDSFVPNHVVQCRRLSELSIQKAPQSQLQNKQPNILPDSPPAYKMQTEAGLLLTRNMRLTSAEERRKKQISPSAVKPPSYNRIIKRVLERYDPSQNQVRSRMPSHLTSPKGVLA